MHINGNHIPTSAPPACLLLASKEHAAGQCSACQIYCDIFQNRSMQRPTLRSVFAQTGCAHDVCLRSLLHWTDTAVK